MKETKNPNNFTNLFGKAGEFGSFNDLKQPGQRLEDDNTTDEQLKNEVGLNGVTLFNRRGRIRITDTGPVREQGCSSVRGFFDASPERADEVLF